ncbi:hypothetical protein A3E49_00910 [Candidatus Saccharibacteria bacterium RIFCSPHIGHO2_12_FULL_49_19]|nr:MAG: hypothetical protein A2708_01390 [Candidatus Saccharibacteria bacterium RIFCSPHIGHO2_01_FULL_49_21]OGL36708.1 MAG: hypothetical protein A3E49_00910 [Candidatus Saccharibacteria bacterium RIFCSPHIGHO2_12_FULL_49_19]OGL37974.1 MAG: hypothetical protein A3B63_01470 [Candidatus Saccharibacteria bacterium RIFCSPLOWO2_01_FULL_49_22]
MSYGHNSNYRQREKSALVFVLKAFIPYSEANVMLAFKPNKFFNELEKISRYKRATLEAAMREAQRQKMIKLQEIRDERIIRLTARGRRTVRPFVAKKLPGDTRLMVSFDIPEDMAVQRAKFRRVLKDWHFKQAQKSVWLTSYDHKQSVKELIGELDIANFVQLYECAII